MSNLVFYMSNLVFHMSNSVFHVSNSVFHMSNSVFHMSYSVFHMSILLPALFSPERSPFSFPRPTSSNTYYSQWYAP